MKLLVFEDFSGDLAIVEWLPVGADNLVGLVTLAGNQSAIAWACFCECKFDGSVTVWFDVEVGEAVWETGDDFFDDASRLFRSRVVAGDDGEVSVCGGFAE